jgi:uncharacterized protein HemY
MELAHGAFQKANSSFEAALRDPEASAEAIARAAFKTWIGKYKRLVTGGDRRLAEALREDALQAFTKSESQSKG